VIKFLLIPIVLTAIGIVIWWERSEKSKVRQVFFSLYNKSLAKAKDKDKIYGTSVVILDVMDETDITPNLLHKILKGLERNNWMIVTQNTVKLTAEGVAYFKFKYLSEKIKRDPGGVR
jgi:hypothetical protein